MSETVSPPAPEWVVQNQFQFLEPFLIGTPRQFAVWQGNVVCLRASPQDPKREKPDVNRCEGCPHFGQCEIAGEMRATLTLVLLSD